MQIYRYMNIGTAKPTLSEQAYVPHHMLDIIEPDEFFDAVQYAKMAQNKIFHLNNKGVIPFIVGGTGLYIKALLHGLFASKPSDPNLRLRLKNEAEIHGTEIFYQKLCQFDPEAALRIHPNDTYRIIRGLEVYELTGKTISEYQREHRFIDCRFRVLKIGLEMNRKSLYDRIDHRVDKMINAGFFDEVKDLLVRGYSPKLKSMQAIGYRHLVDFVYGRFSWDETLRLLKRDTRRYAKRQMTWFKADTEIVWIEPGQLNDLSRLIEDFMEVK